MALIDIIYKYRFYILLILSITLLITVYLYQNRSFLYLEPKYIICFPKGGLISMMKCINEAYGYAVKYNRVLVIDSRKNWFKESLYDYFFIHSPYVYVGDIDFLYKKLLPLSMYPSSVNLLNINDLEERKYNLDLNRDYSEKLIIHSHYGGSSNTKAFFDIVSLKPTVYKSYISARERLPSTYVGVHISNKDDVSAFLDKYRALLKDKTIFMASPFKETIELFKKEFSVVTFSDVPYKNYEEPVGVDIHRYNTDTLVDLFLLASSSELYCGESSYARAAIELHEDPVLLKRLLTESPVKD